MKTSNNTKQYETAQNNKKQYKKQEYIKKQKKIKINQNKNSK